MSETISSGLTITIPTLGQQNWSESIRDDCFVPISEHDHTGGGNGLQIATGALATDAVTDVKILLRNDNYLRARNAAGSADLSLLKADSSDNTWLNTASGKTLKLAINGTAILSMSSSGHLLPVTDNTYDIGSATARMRAIYTPKVLAGTGSALALGANGTEYYAIGTTGNINIAANDTYDFGSASGVMARLFASALHSKTGGDLSLGVAGSVKWKIDGSAYHFVPSSDGALTIGLAGTRVATVFANTIAGGNSGSLAFSSAGTTRFTLNTSGHLSSNADATYDLGISSTNEFRAVYAATFGSGDSAVAVSAGSGDLTLSAAGDVILSASGSDVIIKSAAAAEAWRFSGNSLLPVGDGTQTVGAAGTRVATLFVTTLAGGTSGALNLSSAGTTRFTLDTSGNLTVGSGNAYDIGASGATIKDVFARRLISGSNAMTIETSSTNDLTIKTNATSRWAIGGSAGHLAPATDNTYDLGTSSAKLRAVYSNVYDLSTSTWTPTLSVPTGTYTSTSIGYARYVKLGKFVHVIIQFSGTTSLAPAYIDFTLPVAAANLGTDQIVIARTADAAVTVGEIFLNNNSTTARCYTSIAAAGWTAGAGRGIYANFIYEATS